MKRLLLISLVSLGLLTLASCKGSEAAATKEVQAEDAKMEVAKPHGVAVETLSMNATVQSIDAANLTIILKDSDGHLSTQKCGKDVINFDQIKVGDQVKATITEEMAISVRKSGDPASLGAGAAVALAPKGAKPGMYVSDVGEITAKVSLVDAVNHTVTLVGPEGNSRTFHVDSKVNLDGVRIGDDVTAQYARSLTIMVEKP